MSSSKDARATLVNELREHALVIGDVTLSSGKQAAYYVDAHRAVLRPRGFLAAGELLAEAAVRHGAEAVGGPVMAAIPLSCAAIAVPRGAGLVGFFVRKEGKAHGLTIKNNKKIAIRWHVLILKLRLFLIKIVKNYFLPIF